MLALSFFTSMFKFFSSELHVYIIILNNVIIRKVVFSKLIMQLMQVMYSQVIREMQNYTPVILVLVLQDK